ncbi:hypothetical protein DRJ19_02805 [Candidatus Woesearchaeota archaeon]|nr:MAG: hypothetical protein DRJ19_02805 [Candidatus Woesearchaeota archaeon]RLE43890.1 MAG: hypothetical protein DRJ16_03230 [Candidatus Woesearchaeota archaeon]
MKILVYAKPGKAENKVLRFDRKERIMEVWIKEKAIEGKANQELIKFLTRYFKKRVKLLKGGKSRKKIIEVED